MPEEEIRILHAGDVLLDSPFPVSRAKESERRRTQCREAFVRLLQTAVDRGVSVLLLSGNLIDRDFASYDMATRLSRWMGAHPSVKIFIAAGEKDALGEDSLLSVCSFPDNVKIFESNHCSLFQLPELSLTVGGWSYTSVDAVFSPLSKSPSETADSRLVLCGTVGHKGMGAQITEKQLANSGALYIGLSGGDPFTGFHEADKTIFAQSGPLEARSYADIGYGGANLITLRQDGTMETERLTLGLGQYAKEEIDISAVREPKEIEAQLFSLIKEKGYNNNTSLCVVYTGHTAPNFVPPAFTAPENFGIAEIVTMDHSLPDRDSTDYTKDMSVRGELVRAMMGMVTSEDTKNSETAAKALRITFTALDNGDITNI